MPYFIILPVFLALELLLVAAVVATFLSAQLRPYRPHVLQSLVWGSLGFLAANAALLLLTIAVVRIEDQAQAAESPVVKMLLLVLMLPGPFIASAAGFGLGTIVGLRRAMSRVGSSGPTKS